MGGISEDYAGWAVGGSSSTFYPVSGAGTGVSSFKLMLSNFSRR